MLYILIIFLIFVDLVSKYIAKINLDWQINLIWDFLYLKYIENPWIAFGLWLTWIPLKIITIILIAVIIWYYIVEEKNKKNTLIDLSFAFIISWALGNAYERIFNSQVIDFIWIKYFAIFNLADAFLTIWVFLYIIHLIKLKVKS